MTQQSQAGAVGLMSRGVSSMAVRVGFRSPWAACIDLASEDRQACSLPHCRTVRNI